MSQHNTCTCIAVILHNYVPGGLGRSRLSVEEVDCSFALESEVSGERGAALDLACVKGEWEVKYVIPQQEWSKSLG